MYKSLSLDCCRHVSNIFIYAPVLVRSPLQRAPDTRRRVGVPSAGAGRAGQRSAVHRPRPRARRVRARHRKSRRIDAGERYERGAQRTSRRPDCQCRPRRATRAHHSTPLITRTLPHTQHHTYALTQETHASRYTPRESTHDSPQSCTRETCFHRPRGLRVWPTTPEIRQSSCRHHGCLRHASCSTNSSSSSSARHRYVLCARHVRAVSPRRLHCRRLLRPPGQLIGAHDLLLELLVPVLVAKLPRR